MTKAKVSYRVLPSGWSYEEGLSDHKYLKDAKKAAGKFLKEEKYYGQHYTVTIKKITAKTIWKERNY